MDAKTFLKKNLMTILCALALVAMFLPFASVTTESKFTGSETVSVGGFASCSDSFWGILLIVGAVLLVVMNYIKPLENYKGILSMVIPVVCLIALIMFYLAICEVAEAGNKAAGEMNKLAGSVGVDAGMKITTSIGAGVIIAALAYVGMIVFGIITQKDIIASKGSLANLKAAGAGLIKNATDGVSKAASGISNSFSGDGSAKPSKTKAQIDETLELIERLAKMKDAGLLTDEEFQNKKTKLLEEI